MAEVEGEGGILQILPFVLFALAIAAFVRLALSPSIWPGRIYKYVHYSAMASDTTAIYWDDTVLPCIVQGYIYSGAPERMQLNDSV